MNQTNNTRSSPSQETPDVLSRAATHAYDTFFSKESLEAAKQTPDTFAVATAPEFMRFSCREYASQGKIISSSAEEWITSTAAVYFVEDDKGYVAVVHSKDPKVNVLFGKIEHLIALEAADSAYFLTHAGSQNYSSRWRSQRKLISREDPLTKQSIAWARDHGTIVPLETVVVHNLHLAPFLETGWRRKRLEPQFEGFPSLGTDPFYQAIAHDEATARDYLKMLTERNCGYGYLGILSPSDTQELGVDPTTVEIRNVSINSQMFYADRRMNQRANLCYTQSPSV